MDLELPKETEAEKFWRILKTPTPQTLVQKFVEAKQAGELTPALGKEFINIATRFVNRPQFMHYPGQDEMISEAILAMCKHWKSMNINSDKQTIFICLTQLSQNAILRYIQQNKKQDFIKEHLLDELNTDSLSAISLSGGVEAVVPVDAK